MPRTLWWENNQLKMIDQRILPLTYDVLTYDDHVTVAEARERVAKAGLPPPSIVVNSGNGVHLYWLLDEPFLIDDAGDPPPVRDRPREAEQARGQPVQVDGVDVAGDPGEGPAGALLGGQHELARPGAVVRRIGHG